MNKLYMSVITLVIGLALSSGAGAASMSEDQYKAEKDSISAAYKSAKENCKSMSGNAKDICMAEATGKEKVAKAELEANYKPSGKARRKVMEEKVEADYKIAMEKCDDQGGNLKDVCVKEAKAAMKSAKADAKASKKGTQGCNRGQTRRRVFGRQGKVRRDGRGCKRELHGRRQNALQKVIQ
jgi:hypothetical protein